MRIGVISEGHSDRAVILNIITGITRLDSSDLIPIRPEVDYDETDKAFRNPNLFSTWSLVKKECQEREKIEQFLALEGHEYVVIHIDTAEAGNYGIARPTKDKDYCVTLRNLVIAKINEWLEDNHLESVLYAIAIEEIDAWILTIHEQKDSTKSVSPKEKLKRVLGRKNINSTVSYNNYLLLSEPLSREREVKKGKFLEYNCSLKLFFEEVKSKVVL